MHVISKERYAELESYKGKHAIYQNRVYTIYHWQLNDKEEPLFLGRHHSYEQSAFTFVPVVVREERFFTSSEIRN